MRTTLESQHRSSSNGSPSRLSSLWLSPGGAYRLLWEESDTCENKQNQHSDSDNGGGKDDDVDGDDGISVTVVVSLAVSWRGVQITAGRVSGVSTNKTSIAIVIMVVVKMMMMVSPSRLPSI